MLTLHPADKFMQGGDTAPNLRPLPTSPAHVPPSQTARAIWRRWAALPKVPVMVTAHLEAPLEDTAQLDAVLGVGALRLAPDRQAGCGRDAWVIPLPLGLLGVVPVGKHRLPVWASTPFAHDIPGQLDALCLGDLELVRAALAEVWRVADVRVLRWDVRPAPISEAEALEVILAARPLPETHDRFCPPYWHDWRAEDSTAGKELK